MTATLGQDVYVMAEVSELYDYMNPDAAQWSAERLRHEAGMVES